jgi:hypothetical protein
VDGRGRGLIEVLSSYWFERTKETMKNAISLAGFQSEIRNKYPPITGLEMFLLQPSGCGCCHAIFIADGQYVTAYGIIIMYILSRVGVTIDGVWIGDWIY